MLILLWIPVMAGLNRLRGLPVTIEWRWVYWIALGLLAVLWFLYDVEVALVASLSFALWGSIGWGSYMDMGTMDHRRIQPEKEDPLVDFLISPMKGGAGRDFAGMALVSWRWLPFTIFFYGWWACLVWPVLALALAGLYAFSIRTSRDVVRAEYLFGAVLGVLFVGAFS